jgi:hypothetical protein
VVLASSWQYDTGPLRGDIVALGYDLATGALVDGSPPIVLRQQFAALDTPLAPEGAFNADGSLLYLPLLSVDGVGRVHTTLVACVTVAAGCQGAARRWTGVTSDGVVSLLVPFAADTLVAAVGPYQTWFLTPGPGRWRTWARSPSAPPATSRWWASSPAGPGSSTSSTVPARQPHGGGGGGRARARRAVPLRLWQRRVPVAGLTIGVDEVGQAWFRVGLDQVKPLPLSEYRASRGTTIVP